MKKSELKALIREVIEEISAENNLDWKAFGLDGKPVEIENGFRDECDECGDVLYDTYFVPMLGGHRCESCLEKELKKHHYKIVKK